MIAAKGVKEGVTYPPGYSQQKEPVSYPPGYPQQAAALMALKGTAPNVAPPAGPVYMPHHPAMYPPGPPYYPVCSTSYIAQFLLLSENFLNTSE